MTWLILSILANAAIYIFFKYFEKKGVHLFTAIVFNYLTAFLLGFLIVPDRAAALESAAELPVWFTGALGLGVIFIGIFYLMGFTAQKVGVAVATIASKMSLAPAVVLLALLANEMIPAGKIIAIILALSGVVLTSLRKSEKGFDPKYLVFPLIILVGSTIIDFGVAYLSAFPANDYELALFSCLSFFVAGIIGFTIIIYRLIMDKTFSLRWKNIMAGLALGVVNYGSIYFIVQAYTCGLWPMSTILPVNNLGVVIVSAVAAIFLFREKLNRKNWIGLILSVVALAILIAQR